MNTNNYFEDIKKVKKQPESHDIETDTLKNTKGADHSSRWVWIIYILVAIISIFVALYVGYYIGKNKGINIGYFQAKSGEQTNQSQDDTTKEPASQSASSAEKAADKTYKVQAGDTLFAIGLKFNVPWTTIAEANGLSENSVIKEGDKLKVPVDAKETNEKTYVISESGQQKYQNNVDDGLEKWRLDPVEVCKRTIPNDLEITKSDIYTLTNQNTEIGEASVEITHAGQIFKATLKQPITKGEKGIWAVEKVTNQ